MILEIAEKLGYNLVKVGNVFKDKNHDSLIIFPHTDSYYRFSESRGVNAYNLIMNTLNCDFEHALKFVKDNKINNIFDRELQNEKNEQKKLIIPKRNENSDKIIEYLSNVRKISKSVIFDLIKRKIIFEDINNNLCFLGKDINGKIKNITRRSLKNKEFLGVYGSQKSYPFVIENNNKKIIVTEGEIDSISMYEKFKKNYTYIALSSIADLGLIKYIEDRKLNNIEVFLCLDGDLAGDLGTEKILKDISKLELNIKVKDIRNNIYKNTGVKDPNELLIKNKQKNLNIY